MILKIQIVQDSEPFYAVLIEDLTDRVQLTKQVQQAQKMESIGHLTNGIAHDGIGDERTKFT